MQLNEERSVTVIKAQKGWLEIDLRGIWQYRDLIYLLVRRDFVAIYKQTVLGPLWFLLQPIFSTVVFSVIFGKVAQISTDGLPYILFYLSGIVTWNYFSSCLTKSSDTFLANASIFGKVYFPRLVAPISLIITNLLTFGIQFALFLLFFIYYWLIGTSIQPNGWILIVPLLIIQMAMLGLGCGIIVSSLTTRYRDLNYLVGFGMQLWMYATPVVYPLSIIPAQWRWLYILNPMASIIETFRYAFLGQGSIDSLFLIAGFVMTLGVLLVGVVLFNKTEKNFMDTI
jgi:ABC-type polysaccharide/polyol phosphate export systems, permease component